MQIGTLLTTMAALLTALAVGFFGAKLHIIDDGFNKKLTGLLLALIQPCKILSSVLNVERTLSNVEFLQLAAISAGCYLLLIPLSQLLIRVLRVPEEDRGTYRFMLIFSNVGFVGYPVVEALYGDGAGVGVTAFVLMFQLVTFTYGVHLLSGGGQPFRFHWRVLLRPLVIVALVAMGIYLTGLRVPAVLASMVSYVGDLSTPVSMMIIGCSLAGITIGEILGNRRIYVLVVIKMLVIPLVVNLALRGALGTDLRLGVTTAILAMPIAANATALTLAYGGSQKLASAGVFLSTILSVFTIPTIMWLLFS